MNDKVKTLVIRTVQIAKWRKAKAQYPSVPLVDVTVKSGIKALAPTWDFLMEYKNSDKGPEAEEAYTKKYRSRIQQLNQDDPDVMLELLHQEEIILMCYCPAGKFCHRLLLVDEFFALGEEHCIEVIYEGEIE